MLIHFCPVVSYSWGRFEPHVPLGILSLGAVGESLGHTVHVKDLNIFCSNSNELDRPRRLAGFLLENAPDILGFTTICNSYPVTLRLARECKRLSPKTIILLGGPQASATATETMRHFDYVDAIVAGEGEVAFKTFLHSLEAGASWKDVPNLVWRSRKNIVRNEVAPLIENLDDLPLPAYHLSASCLYGRESMPVEAGRGCPYQCVYCSTSRFWGNRFRMKSVKRLLHEIRSVTSTFGAHTVELMHDNFTVSRQFCLDFCAALKASDLDVRWCCSGRIDVVNQALAKEMADAGCFRIFFGIESGSDDVRRSINRRMDYSCVIPNARAISRHNITCTGSFIGGFPEESLEDLRDTLTLLFQFHFAADKQHVTYLHILSPLPSTPIYDQYKERLEFDAHTSDIAISNLGDKDKELIKRYPDIFSSFYTITNDALPRDYQDRVYLIVNFLPMYFPFTSYLLWKHEGKRLVDSILEQAVHLRTDDTNIFSQDRMEILRHLYHFVRVRLLPNVATIEGLSDLLLYEQITTRTERGGSHIEVFDYDVGAGIKAIKQRRCVNPFKGKRNPTAILFAYEDGTVETTKLHLSSSRNIRTHRRL